MPGYQRIVWVGLAVTAIAILALAYFLFLAPAGAKKEVTVPETSSLAKLPEQPAATAGEEGDPAITPLDLALDGSDDAVRSLVSAAGIPAVMVPWLGQKDLVRTAVAAVDAVARGESPAAQLRFLAPAEGFPVLERNGKLVMDPRGFRRYDPLVSAFVAVPDRTWVVWYRTLHPTLEKAFAELGYPGVTFAQRLGQALAHLAQSLPPAGDAALERKLLSYGYAEPALEELSAAQKHLLRLGPGNAGRIRKKLQTLAAALKLNGKS
jgi:hypothetical protein